MAKFKTKKSTVSKLRSDAKKAVKVKAKRVAIKRAVARKHSPEPSKSPLDGLGKMLRSAKTERKIDYVSAFKGRTPSHYQRKILDFVADPNAGNGRVIGVAGCSKTTTLEAAINVIPAGARIAMIAFNRHIVEELTGRLVKRDGLDVRTFHSLGWEFYRTVYSRAEINDRKVDDIFYFDATRRGGETETNPVLKGEYKNASYTYRAPVKRLVSLMKNHFVLPDDDITECWKELAEKYGVQMPRRVDPELFDRIVCETYHQSCVRKGRVDYDDMIFMPLLLDLPFQKYDWVLVDESQDLNRIQLEFIRKLLADEGRLLAVGDPMQAIYRFRGADSKAMDTLQSMFNTTDLPLSICYRCAKNIVKEAQTLVPYIEAWDNAKPGIVKTVPVADFNVGVNPGDMVLCRTTAPLIQNAMKMIKRGVKALVRGKKEIGSDLMDLAKTVAGNYPDMCLSDGLDAYYHDASERFRGRNAEMRSAELADAIESIQALLLVPLTPDEQRSIDVLEGTKRDIAIVGAAINRIFSDEDTPAVILSTIHGAKGLECPNVWIINPELLPHPKAELEEDLVQEQNLKYVAITRAQEALYWVRDTATAVEEPTPEPKKTVTDDDLVKLFCEGKPCPSSSR